MGYWILYQQILDKKASNGRISDFLENKMYRVQSILGFLLKIEHKREEQ
jgi:hypothetical protein